MPFVPHPRGHTPPRAVFRSCDVTGAPGNAGPWVPPPEPPRHEGRSPWPAMPRPVLQMALCARISRLILPGTMSRKSPKTVPPRRSRVNGWSQPVHYLQVVAWIMFLVLAFTTFGIFIPLLPPEWRYIAYSVSFYWGHCCRLRGGGAPGGASSWPGSGPPAEVVRPALRPCYRCQCWRPHSCPPGSRWLGVWAASAQQCWGRERVPSWQQGWQGPGWTETPGGEEPRTGHARSQPWLSGRSVLSKRNGGF